MCYYEINIVELQMQDPIRIVALFKNYFELILDAY